MDINAMMSSIEDVFYSPTFMKMIEDNLTFLRTTKAVVTNISSTQSVKYAGDFFGLLVDLKIEKRYHYVVMRVNNYLSSADFNGTVTNVIVPDLTEIDLLKNVLQTGSF